MVDAFHVQMVRIVATIALILALATSASAMTQPRYATIGSESTSGTATVSTSSQAVANDLMIMVCYDITGGSLTAITTGGLTWTTVTGTGLPLTNILVVTRTVGVSEPATVGATFTATHRAACGIAYQHNSDGTVPTLDIACGSTTNTVCSVTTARPNDSLVYATVAASPLHNTAAALPFAPLFIYQGPSLSIDWVYGGQGASGASITPTFDFNGGSVGGIITLAFKNTSATAAANFVGLGTEGFNGGSSLTVGPTTATNSTAGSNSISIAGISQLAGSTGIAITAPPQIVYRYAPVFVSGAGNQTFTIDANSVAGDFLTETFGNGAVMSAPAACGAHAWTTLASSGSFIGVFAKILDSCDPGHTYSFTGFSGGVNRGAIDFVSQGPAISVDVASCGAIGSTSNPSIPSITTTSNNDTAFSALFGQGLATTPVPPASNFILWQNNGSAAAAGLYRQDTAGATGAQNYTTPSAAQTWLACNVSLKTSTAAASPWNTVAACPTGIADPTGNNQTTAFWAANLPQNVTELFSFASKPASSGGRIYNFNGLNSTNPIDVCATLGLPGMDNIYAPSLTPTPNDDGILRLFPASTSNVFNAPGFPWLNLLIASTNANGPSAVFDSLGQVKSEAVTNNGDGNAFGSLSLGLNASQ